MEELSDTTLKLTLHDLPAVTSSAENDFVFHFTLSSLFIHVRAAEIISDDQLTHDNKFHTRHADSMALQSGVVA